MMRTAIRLIGTAFACLPAALTQAATTMDGAEGPITITPLVHSSVQIEYQGLVIQVDDTVYDGSLRTRLKQLRGRLDNRSIHEIQSGRDRFSHPKGN